MSGGQTPGQQNSFQTQNTTSTSAPSPEIQPYLKQLVGSLGNYLGANPGAPSLFGGSFTAGPSDATQSGYQMFRDVGANGLAGYGIDDASKRNLADTLGGKYLNPANNPYLQGGLRAGFDQQNDSFNNTVLPALRSQFATRGRSGSTEDFDTTMRGAYDMNKAQAAAAANAETGAYQAERGNQMQAQSMLPSFLGMDLSRAGALEHAGQGADAFNQKRLDEQIYRDTYGKTSYLDYLSNLASRFQGAYPGGTTTGSGTSQGWQTYMPPTNPTSSILGTGMGLASLGLSAAGLFM